MSKNKKKTQAANEQENSNENQNSEINHDFDLGFFSKLFAPAKVLIKLHLKVAYHEFKKDSSRFGAGVIQIIMGLFFLITFFMLFDVLAIAVLYQYAFDQKNIIWPVLIVTGFNLLLAIFAFLSAKSKFNKAFFNETKKMVRETLDDFSD